MCSAIFEYFRGFDNIEFCTVRAAGRPARREKNRPMRGPVKVYSIGIHGSGFTLIEQLAALALTSIFMLVAFAILAGISRDRLANSPCRRQIAATGR